MFYPILGEMNFLKPRGQSLKEKYREEKKNYARDSCSYGEAQPWLEESSTLLTGKQRCLFLPALIPELLA